MPKGTVAVDILGRAIKPNQVVTYPINTSSGLACSVADVVDVVSPDCIRLRTQRKDGSNYTFNFTRLDRVTIAVGA